MGFQGKVKHVLRRTLAALVLTVFMVAGMVQSPALATDPAPSAQATQIWNQVKDEFKSTTFQEIGKYLNPRTRFLDTAEAIQVYKENHNGQTPNQTQIQEQLVEFAIRDIGFDISHPKVMANLDRLMPRIIDSAQQYQKDPAVLRNDKLALLVALSYLYRFYDFDFGNQSAVEDIIFNTQSSTTTPPNSYQRLLDLVQYRRSGQTYVRNADSYLGLKTAETYASLVARHTGYPTLVEYLEAKIAEHEPGVTAQAWFEKTTQAVIEDNLVRPLWTKFKEVPNVTAYLLPLLSLSDNSAYVANSEFSVQFGLTSIYGGADNADFRAELKKTVNGQQRYMDFWERMTKKPADLNAITHVIVIDKWAPLKSGFNTRQQWFRPYKQGADKALVELFYTMIIRNNGQNVGAEASGTRINFYSNEAVSDEGVSTYAHEMTHIYDKAVWFNGYGRRAKMQVEDYARGVFEPENNAPSVSDQRTYEPIFNLNLAYDSPDDRTQNLNPERFQTPVDVHQYMNGYMDVINSLDAMEALATLALPNEDKALLYNQVSAEPNVAATWKGQSPWSATIYEGTWKDVFKHITVEQAAGLTSINDLVDNQITSAKYFAKNSLTSEGEIPVNEYVTVNTFEPIYAGLPATNEGTGSVMFRRYAYDILGEYGWDDGFIAYLSGQYPDEQTALRSILTRHGGNIATFKKDMYQRRVDKFDQMKPAAEFADAAAMQVAMKQAVAADLAFMKANPRRVGYDPAYYVRNVRDLKMRILNSYLKSTNDFRDTIYKEKYKWELPVAANVTLKQDGQNVPVSANESKIQVTPQFELQGSGVTGLPTAAVTVPAGGNVDLSRWQFAKSGIYVFEIKQISGVSEGVTYDVKPVTMTVTATAPTATPADATADSDGAILVPAVVAYEKDGQKVTTALFENVLKSRSSQHVPAEIGVSLSENGRAKTFADGDFAIVVTLADGAPEGGVTGLPTDEVTNVGGHFTITPLTFTKPGVYTVTYQQVDKQAERITYDLTPIVGTYTVTESATTRTEFDVVGSYTKNGQAVNPVQLLNTYQKPEDKYRWELPVSATVTFTEAGQPKAFQKADFKVQVMADDANPATAGGVPAGEIEVNADGTVDLSKWIFTEVGTYVFTVSQVLGDAPNTTYDGKPVTVTVHVEKPTAKPADKQAGADGFIVLEPRVELMKDGQPAQEITFANTYMTPVPVETFVDTTETVVIDVVTQEIADPDQYVGIDVVMNAGSAGEKQIVKRQRYVDGQPVGDPVVVSETTTKEMEPRVIRKGSKPNAGSITVVTTEVIAVETVYEDDATLEVGKEEVLDEGSEGQVEVTSMRLTWNGQPQNETVVSRKTVVEMKPKRIRRGTKAAILEPAVHTRTGAPVFVDPLPELVIPEVPSVVVPQAPATNSKPQLANTGTTIGSLLMPAGLVALLGVFARRLSRRKQG